MKFPASIFLSALSLPFIQAIIWKVGMTLSSDLYRQFEHVGVDDGTAFTIVVGGIMQGIIAILLGGVAFLIYGSSPIFEKGLLFLEGVLGTFLLSWLLINHWNFESNHCFPDSGCDLTSPLVFDFVECVFFGLPLLWCLGLICFTFFFRTPTKALQSN